MRKTPKYNDKNSRSSNHMWWGWDVFDLTPDYWPCPLTVAPTKPGAESNTIFIIQAPDSRSGMKGITIRQRMGKL